MKHAEKMILVPMRGGAAPDQGPTATDNLFDQQQQQASKPDPPRRGRKPNPNSIRQYAVERQLKLWRMVLKLSFIKAFDEHGRIINEDGHVDQSSNILPLLNYTMSPGRSVKGLPEFVDLLHRAQVSPEDVINTHVKEMLMKRYGTRPKVRHETAVDNLVSNDSASREDNAYEQEDTNFDNSNGLVTETEDVSPVNNEQHIVKPKIIRKTRQPKSRPAPPMTIMTRDAAQKRKRRDKVVDDNDDESVQNDDEPPTHKQRGSGVRHRWEALSDDSD